MDNLIFIYGALKEAIRDHDWGDACHYSALLKNKGFFEGKSRRGWRIFECEKFQIEGETFGCGAKFMEPTRDCFSPSVETCHICGEEVRPSLGFYDDSLKIDSSCNLKDKPEKIILK